MAWIPIGQVLEHATALVAPPRCAACDEPAPPSELFCAGCDPGPREAEVERFPDGVLLIATGRYEGALATAIKRLKYDQRPDLARLLGARLARTLSTSVLVPCDALVPVPLHRHRLAERGYNQSALVAGAAARRLRTRYLPLVLARPRRTREQASLGRRERQANVEDAFVVRGDVRGASVVIVDDVVTTGATVSACVTALTRAGAHVAAIAALARAKEAPRTHTSTEAATPPLMDDAVAG